MPTEKPSPLYNWTSKWTTQDWINECKNNWGGNWDRMLSTLKQFLNNPSQSYLGTISRTDIQHALRLAAIAQQEFHKENANAHISARLEAVGKAPKPKSSGNSGRMPRIS